MTRMIEPMRHTATMAALLCTALFFVGCGESANYGYDNADTNPEPQATPSKEAAMTPSKDADTETQDVTTGPLQFTLASIDGNEVSLSQYKGDVVLMVNVASKCGLTPQYAELQELHEQYAEQGLSILGFPANEFGGQEPGTNLQIKQFCTANYGVEFDMFEKIVVKGQDIHPLYAYLTEEKTNPKFPGDISWNFEKFLINREGEIVARFPPRTKPSDPKITQAIEAELSKG